MSGIQPFEGETRIAYEQSISDTADSVHEMVKQVTRSNAALDDLNDGLDQLDSQLGLYRLKADEARKKMRRLSSQL